MKFTKYSSIENAYSQKFLDYLENYGLTGGEWVVTEKIHGTNIQIAYDGKEFQFGKRTKWISEIENFFTNCWIPIFLDMMERIKLLYEELEAKTLILYGELFGGHYAHVDVAPIQDAVRIQKGIDYCPGNKLYIFDIKLNGEFMNPFDVEHYCLKYHFLPARILFHGTFLKCLRYPNDFQTTIPGEFNLPSIEGNICEGIVIKPVEAKFLPSGSRAILKSKNEKYADKQRAPKTPKKIKKLSVKGVKLYEEFQTYITMARLDSVMGKEGNLTNKDFGKVLNLVYQDILEDFQKENGYVFNNMEKTERILITKRIRRDIVDLIRTEFFSRV